jgi:hypothetical protein
MLRSRYNEVSSPSSEICRSSVDIAFAPDGFDVIIHLDVKADIQMRVSDDAHSVLPAAGSEAYFDNDLKHIALRQLGKDDILMKQYTKFFFLPPRYFTPWPARGAVLLSACLIAHLCRSSEFSNRI